MASGRTFDPKSIAASFGAIILGDWAKGTIVKVSTDGDDFTMEKGADGEYDRINNNNNLLTVEITLKQTSPINDALSAFRTADKLGNVGGVPLLIKDMGPGGTSTVAIPKCHIKKAPDMSVADSLQPRTWVLEGAGTMFIGSNS